MPCEIIFSQDAAKALRGLRAYDRIGILDAIETHLRHDPTRTSRTRIKALRGLRQPQYRLRIGEVRVFYDVGGGVVQVLAVVSKADAAAWLARWGVRAEEEGESP